MDRFQRPFGQSDWYLKQVTLQVVLKRDFIGGNPWSNPGPDHGSLIPVEPWIFSFNALYSTAVQTTPDILKKCQLLMIEQRRGR